MKDPFPDEAILLLEQGPASRNETWMYLTNWTADQHVEAFRRGEKQRKNREFAETLNRKSWRELER